jgi:hypothetical protein
VVWLEQWIVERWCPPVLKGGAPVLKGGAPVLKGGAPPFNCEDGQGEERCERESERGQWVSVWVCGAGRGGGGGGGRGE